MLRIALIGSAAVLIIVVFNFSTTPNKHKFKRQLINVNKEIFYSKYKKVATDTLLNAMIPEINKAFELNDIQKSNADYEIRVYFFNAYGELFFRQKFLNDSTEATVFNCKTKKREDSLLMQVKNVVNVTGEYKYDNSFDLGNIPKYFTKIDTAEREGVTDDGALYFIQLKRKNIVNFLVIDKPFEMESSNELAKSICDMVRKFRLDFSFKFHDPILKILDSAFIKPYGIESVPSLVIDTPKEYFIKP